jgi:hypothetical protein
MRYSFLIFGLLVAGAALGQTTEQVPVPLEAEEIPDWLEKLYRFETVAVGAFPFAIMISGLGADFVIYAEQGFDSAFLPWPPGNVNTAWLASGRTQDDLNQRNLATIGASVGLSLLVAGIDWLLGEISE